MPPHGAERGRRGGRSPVFPSGEFIGDAFGLEFEQALGTRVSVAAAPYLQNHDGFGTTMSGRFFVVGRAPSGFWVGASGYGEYYWPAHGDSVGSQIVGWGPAAGYTFVYGPWMTSVGATPFFQWQHLSDSASRISGRTGWFYDRINTKLRANV